ncbi:hypothetical protein, conserved [Perkinsus marinus ATCC 50983]|uniref:Uncharacterized protein n=1 Tax=Perkinsus marinus (strain ATCC 50983 / TXsc) TaxID=423536 RepID=C5KSK2_PERM5|nr:hypothetical protein, conserved [Perkinsus marinus ATCC 50983]EER12551.1 hypothetical protein, conserved [Perkinsus marinus ATCC 50983]|eukprot:XP_002780756.1 hypothetical protein, conserved [Perkinsus marinus ATCC 50983]
MACWSPPRAKPEEQLTFHDKILRDIPLTSREWASTTHEMTDIEIRGPSPVMHNRQRQPLARYIVTKPASELGGPVHFSSGVQYEAQVASGMRLSKHAKASLREFILKPEINFAIEQALQQNETMDVFARDFDKLGVDESRMAMLDASLGSGAETGLTEWRNFHDVTYTREKRIECIHWVPGEPDVVAASYLDNLTYGQRLETMGKDLMLAVSDWEFSLWYIGGSAPSLTRPRRANMDEEEEEGDEVETARPVKSLADRIREPIFRSAAPSNYFACGACSPSRPAVLYLGRVDGSVDVWDFTDQSHQPLMSFPVTAAGLTSMTFCPEGKSLMAVGDDHGHLHVLKLPVNLVWGPDREEEIVRQILDHAYHNLDGVPERKTMLEALKQQNEKVSTTIDL